VDLTEIIKESEQRRRKIPPDEGGHEKNNDQDHGRAGLVAILSFICLIKMPPVRGLLHGINTGMCHKRDLTDQQWKILALVPEASRSGKQNEIRDRKSWLWQTGMVPVAICIESATPHEVKLATNTPVHMVIPDAPKIQ
jgi:hypothetical protein